MKCEYPKCPRAARTTRYCLHHNKRMHAKAAINALQLALADLDILMEKSDFTTRAAMAEGYPLSKGLKEIIVDVANWNASVAFEFAGTKGA